MFLPMRKPDLAGCLINTLLHSIAILFACVLFMWTLNIFVLFNSTVTHRPPGAVGPRSKRAVTANPAMMHRPNLLVGSRGRQQRPASQAPSINGRTISSSDR